MACECTGKQSEVNITPAQRIFSSACGSVLTMLLVTPMDVVKVRLQMQQKYEYSAVKPKKPFLTPMDVIKVRLQMQHKVPAGMPSCFMYCNGITDHLIQCNICPNGNGTTVAGNTASAVSQAYKAKEWYNRPGRFNGTFDAFVKICRNEGVTALWSGLPPTLLMAIPANVIYFSLYDHLKYKFGFREDDPSTVYRSVMAGISARTFCTFLITPFELLRTKMQSEKLTYEQLYKAVKVSVHHGGPQALWRGLAPLLLRDVPFSGLYWVSYETLKSVQVGYQNMPPTLTQSFLAGAGAGCLCTVVTQPFDIVKTQMQIELGQADKIKQKNTFGQTWRCVYRLYHQGWASMYAGLTPRLLRVTPSCAVMISSYELGKSYFSEYNSRHMLDQNTHQESVR